ncbi:DUF397 domain-containing protein [Nocardia sp. IFM 10818]
MNARLPWRTPQASSNGENCVQFAPHGEAILVRHSKSPDGGTIVLAKPAWQALVDAARGGVFGVLGALTIQRDGNDVLLRDADGHVELRFDDGEWTAFVCDARAGHLDTLAVA